MVPTLRKHSDGLRRTAGKNSPLDELSQLNGMFCVPYEQEINHLHWILLCGAYGWPPLAESTLARKAADTPLLETGEMRDSISHTVTKDEAHIGSDSDVALWQELGTSRIPPRSFLQGALQHKTEEIISTIGRGVVGSLRGDVD